MSISETEFYDTVGAWVETRFGADNVDHEPVLRTDRLLMDVSSRSR